MAETVTGLRDAIINEASFDVTTATALSWLNRSWRRMVGDARAYRDLISVGNTVADQAFYAVPSVLEVFNLTVAGVPYTRARRNDSYADQQGRLLWTYQGEVGLFEPGVNASAARGVTLIPAPAESGLAIAVVAATAPPDLTADGTGDALLAAVLDGEEVHEGLISGALAIGYSREGNVALRDANLAAHAADTAKLASTTRGRFRGPGAAQIRIAGVNG